MHFFLNDIEHAVCDSLTRWLSDHIDLPHWARSDLGPSSQAEARLWGQLLQDLELLELEGGLRLHLRVLWSLGGWLFAEPYLSTGLIAETALCDAKGERVAHWRAAWRQGQVNLAWAHDEPGHRLQRQAVKTVLTSASGEYLLQGQKSHVQGAQAATHFLVSAQSPELGLAWLWLDAQTPGILRRDLQGLDGHGLSEVRFDNVKIPTEAILCHGADAENLRGRLQDMATLGICAEAVGLMQRMMSDTLEHVRQRQQFGQPLASFQVLQHRLADMHLALAQAEALTWAVSDALTMREMTDSERALAVSSCKVCIGRALRCVGQGAVQLHGALGVTEELYVARCFRRATQIELTLGQSSQHLRRMDSLLFEA
jgi:alkylation response protein AidB-like acyl-CoA dehydrogenase